MLLTDTKQRANQRSEDSALRELTETASGELERGIDPRLHGMTFWDSKTTTLCRLASNGRVLRVGRTYRLSDSAIHNLKQAMAARKCPESAPRQTRGLMS